MTVLNIQETKKKNVFDIEGQLLRMPKRSTGYKCCPKGHDVLVLAIILMGGLSVFVMLISHSRRRDEYFMAAQISVFPDTVDEPDLFKIVYAIDNSTTVICGMQRNDKEVAGCQKIFADDLATDMSVFCCLRKDTGHRARIPNLPLSYYFVLPQGNLSAVWNPRRH